MCYMCPLEVPKLVLQKIKKPQITIDKCFEICYNIVIPIR
jgi:hypothetical protein